jgi:hypothetical protein
MNAVTSDMIRVAGMGFDEAGWIVPGHAAR